MIWILQREVLTANIVLSSMVSWRNCTQHVLISWWGKKIFPRIRISDSFDLVALTFDWSSWGKLPLYKTNRRAKTFPCQWKVLTMSSTTKKNVCVYMCLPLQWSPVDCGMMETGPYAWADAMVSWWGQLQNVSQPFSSFPSPSSSHFIPLPLCKRQSRITDLCTVFVQLIN